MRLRYVRQGLPRNCPVERPVLRCVDAPAGYLYVIDGRVDVDDEPLRTGDAIKVTGAIHLTLRTNLAAELILVDVPLEFERIGVWAGEW